jgi:archaellum component FlaC
MDPLKLRAMGVKKPLEDKKEKIEHLQEEYKRYYPVDKNG